MVDALRGIYSFVAAVKRALLCRNCRADLDRRGLYVVYNRSRYRLSKSNVMLTIVNKFYVVDQQCIVDYVSDVLMSRPPAQQETECTRLPDG